MSTDTTKVEAYDPSICATYWILRQDKNYRENDLKLPEVIGGKAALSDAIADRLKRYVDGEHRGFLIATSCGHWGNGDSLLSAAQNALKVGAKRTALATAAIVLGDSKPGINEYGYTITESVAHTISLGRIGTVGSIINSNKGVS